MNYRVAFTGASGTGKTTLANFVAEKLNIPFNPIGSRSVAIEMGFVNPYDVDKAGKRAEFQKKLLADKRKWEEEHPSFVTDRTTADNLVYTMLHDVYSVGVDDLSKYMGGLHRYTHIIHCPIEAFCHIGEDPARVKEITYHHLYDAALEGVYEKFYKYAGEERTSFFSLARPKTLEQRKEVVSRVLNL